MNRSQERWKHAKPLSFAVLTVIMLLTAAVAGRGRWRGSSELHTFQETIAFVLALMAGTLAMVRYYTKKTSMFLLLGTGFLGSALLDGYHALITSAFLVGFARSQNSALVPWSGATARVFLSLLIAASCLMWRRDHPTPDTSRSREIAIYSLVSVWILTSFLLFTLLPLPPIYNPGSPVHRSGDLLPGLFFALAAAAYIRQGAWKSRGFEYWLVLSLILSASGHLALMSRSAELYDPLHVCSHWVKIASYLFVLTGLVVSAFSIFRRESVYAAHLEQANRFLEAEIRERSKAEESLRQAHARMEELVEERTARVAEANRALSVSEDRFRIAAENASDVIWECDFATGQIRLFRQSGAGCDDRDFASSLGEFEDSLHLDDRERVMKALERLREAAEPFRQEYRVFAANGEIVYHSSRGTAVRDTQGRLERCVGVTSDITDRKRAEEALSHLAAIVESSEAAIISKALDGTVLTWNAAAERMFGYSLATIKFCRSVIVPDDRLHEDAELLQGIIRGECVHHMETVRVRKDGTRFNVAQTVSPIRNAAGNVIGGSWVIWDITAQKALERQLAQAQKLESIGQLAAGIAHEINTPIQYLGDNILFIRDSFSALDGLLRTVQEFLANSQACRSHCNYANRIDTLARDGDLEYLREEMPRAISQSLEGVDHIAKIVRAMKDFSHPGPLEKVASDLNRAVESTIQVSRNEWKYVADVTAEFDPDLPPVECIPGEVNQVLLNLIVNAAHSIAEVVNNQAGQRGQIRVSTHKDGNWAEIRVQDTGTGIPETVREKVFDPFFTTKPVGKGTGQGLAIAHSVVVQKHGGSINFETEMGVGTTFVVRLPLERAA